MKREDDQALWDLLGRTSETRLSPFFARNVLRAIRAEVPTRWSQRVGTWLSLKRLLPVTGVAVALLAVALLTHSSLNVPGVSRIRTETPSITRAAQDADLAADLDDLSDDADELDSISEESLF